MVERTEENEAEHYFMFFKNLSYSRFFIHISSHNTSFTLFNIIFKFSC